MMGEIGTVKVDVFVQWKPGLTLAEVEDQTIMLALAWHHGNRTLVAKDLGLSYRSLLRKIMLMRKRGWKIEPRIVKHESRAA
jgi:DNA-binding NtrC family response regulator